MNWSRHELLSFINPCEPKDSFAARNWFRVDCGLAYVSHYQVASYVSSEAGRLIHLHCRQNKLTVGSEFKLQELVSKLSLVPNIISQIKVTC